MLLDRCFCNFEMYPPVLPPIEFVPSGSLPSYNAFAPTVVDDIAQNLSFFNPRLFCKHETNENYSFFYPWVKKGVTISLTTPLKVGANAV